MSQEPPVSTEVVRRFWVVLIAVSLVTSAAMVLASWLKRLDPLTVTLFQVIILGLGLSGSYVGGLGSARRSARELVAVSARPAFRRLLSMYSGLSDLGSEIQTQRGKLNVSASGQNGAVQLGQAENALDVLEARLVAQIATANDAMDDWRDLVPDEVSELEARAAEREGRLSGGLST